MSDWQDTLREHVHNAVAASPSVITGWIFLYETSALDEDGDLGGAWGAVMSASRPTALGLCELAANDMRHDDLEGDRYE